MQKNRKNIYEDIPHAVLEHVHDAHFQMERFAEASPLPVGLHHYHDYYELYYLYSGERYYFIQDQTYHITGGTFVLINPYEIHHTGNLGNFGYDRMLLLFNRELLKDYLAVDSSVHPFKNLDEKIHVISLDSTQRIFVETLLQSMESEYLGNSRRPTAYIRLSLLQLLLFLNSCKPKAVDRGLPQITSTQKTIFEIEGYINTCYAEEITLESIAGKYFLSPFYLSRTFREITGLRFVEYLNNVRIKEAKSLLLHTTMTVDEISAAVGFHSSTHFGRIFKSLEGTTPSAYRKTGRG